jgi:O-methyltransferase
MIRGVYNALTDARVRREWRWYVLRKIRDWVMPSYHLQWPHLAWWNDTDFNSFATKFGLSTMDAERRWVLHELTKLASTVSGDTAECGVFNGSSSYLICQGLGRPHFMFDSFEGMSPPQAIDGAYYSANGMRCPLETAKANLAEFENLSFHQGWIPERFRVVSDRRFCFVHIDVQLYQPTRDSIEFFYPRINSGGILVCDDYGFSTCPGARRAVDEFLSTKPEKILEMPCGNAFLIRR